jgi:hypothetical protein
MKNSRLSRLTALIPSYRLKKNTGQIRPKPAKSGQIRPNPGQIFRSPQYSKAKDDILTQLQNVDNELALTKPTIQDILGN